MSGNAFIQCSPIPRKNFHIGNHKPVIYKNRLAAPVKQNPCQPSPCGPNSQCREVNQQAVCSCIQGFIGSPPNCRPECTSNSECPLSQACLNQKCRDPCPGTCGRNARCTVVNHNPFCTCPDRHTGNPFISCTLISKSLPNNGTK